MTTPRISSLLDASAVVPMTEEQSDVFLRCCVAELSASKELHITPEFDAEHAHEAGPLALVFQRRLAVRAPWVRVGLFAGVLMVYLANGSPSYAVLWAWTATRLYDRTKKIVTVEALAEAFPDGFPTAEEYARIWYAQKGYAHGSEADNLLDCEETWIAEAE